MEFRKSKPKKNRAPEEKFRLPLKNEKQIIGIFNGNSVIVHDLNSMIHLYKSGNFGKGSLSKGEPNNHIRKDDIPKIMFEHQFENQKRWNASASYSQLKMPNRCGNKFQLSLQSLNSFLQSSFSDDEQGSWKSWRDDHKEEFKSLSLRNMSLKTDLASLQLKADVVDYKDEEFSTIVNNILQSKQLWKPKSSDPSSEEVMVLTTNITYDLDASCINTRLDKSPFPTIESLNLNLEESFFLKYVFGCLNVVDLDYSEIDIPNLWEKFNAARKNFTERYITYHYYRTKGWIVKSGLKFGGDFLLYKDGPAHYHANYLVKVLDRKKKLTWKEFLATNRLVETFNKDLILSNVISAETEEEKSFPGVLSNHSVQEVLVKRWFPTKERFSKTDDSLS